MTDRPDMAVGPGFGRRLETLRLRRGLTAGELADRAGLSYRTILDLERGRRARLRVSTLHRLALALGVKPSELSPGRPDPPRQEEEAAPGGRRSARRGRPGRLRLAVGFAVLLALAAAAGLVLRPPLVRLTVEDGALTAHDPLLGLRDWTLDADAPVQFWQESPWGRDLVLVGLGHDGADAGRLLLLRRASGRRLWDFLPDPELAAVAFGPDIMAAGSELVASAAWPVDMDGDGEPEIVANFNHALYYPRWLCLLDRRGGHHGTYLHRGSIYDARAVDLDRDGRQELLLAATNNSKALQGASLLLLDRECHTGVSLDTISGDTVCLPDSARLRVVLPSFGEPWMDLLRLPRLEGSRIRLDEDPGGEPRITLDIRSTGSICTVRLDRRLRPLAVAAGPWLLEIASSWPAGLRGGGPADPGWLRDWLGRALRFEAGHYPPGPCRRPPAVAGDIADGGGGR